MFEHSTFRPLSDRVLIKRLDTQEKTASGLYIPDAAREKGQQGKVIAVGPGRIHDGKNIPLAVQVNDTILFGKYSGTQIDAGDDYLIIREDEILGIIGR